MNAQIRGGMVALAPDVIFSSGSAGVEPLRRATRIVPIVFGPVPLPGRGGFVESLARPGGNITGFSPWEYGIGAKWLELLKQIAPKREACGTVLRDAAITGRDWPMGRNSVRVAVVRGGVAPHRRARRRVRWSVLSRPSPEPRMAV